MNKKLYTLLETFMHKIRIDKFSNSLALKIPSSFQVEGISLSNGDRKLVLTASGINEYE